MPDGPVVCPDIGRNAGGSSTDVGAWGEVSAVHYSFPAPDRPEAASHFSAGPGTFGNNYAPPRSVFPLLCGDDLLIVWQARDSGTIYATQVDEGFSTHASAELLKSEDVLIAAAYGNSTVYLVLLEDPGMSTYRPARLTLHAVGIGLLRGVQHVETLDAGYLGLNVHARSVGGPHGHATLVFHEGRLALMLAREMLRSGDGLNHQGGIAVIFDARTLKQTRYLGQTSGHSFQNYLVAAEDGGLLAIDMADNFPRGVHLHHFDDFDWRRQVVFTFKTRHGTTPQNPAGTIFPVYEELSTGGQTYYKWSNDNSTYSELGAVIEGDGTYTVVFVGEPDEQGRALRNETTNDLLTHAREVGLVTIKSDFQSQQDLPRNVVPDEIVVSIGPREDGSFYTFTGGLEPQRNVGVRWLTDGDDPDSENASRLKAGRMRDDRILLVWERWSRTDYVDTSFMVIDDLGNTVIPATSIGSLGTPYRLPRSDDALMFGGRLLIVTGNPSTSAVDVLAFELSE